MYKTDFREIDKLISEHQMRQVDVATARLAREEVTKSKIQADTGKCDSSDKSETKYNILIDKGYCLKYSLLNNETGSTKNCEEVGDEHQPVEPRKTSHPKPEVADPIVIIRPQIDQIVKGEISRAQAKTQTILNRINESSLDRSAGKPMSDSATCGDGRDDEISKEESLLFLEAFKADATHKMVSSMGTSLGVSDDGDIVCEKEVPHCDSTIASVKSIATATDGCAPCDEDETIELAQERALTWVESEILSYKLYHENSMPTIAEETNDDVVCPACDDESDENSLRNVKSVWWSKETKDVQEIIGQMKNALNTFDSDYIPVSNRSSEIPPESSVKNFTKQTGYTGDHDFTVEEMARILENISTTVDHLPFCNEKSGSYSYDMDYPLTDSQQAQIITILSLLENALDGSISPDDDFSTSFQLDGDEITARKQRVSRTFNMISETLNRTPTELKKQPISAFSPPESLMKTLALVAASGFFRHCFISGILEVQRSEKNADLQNNEFEKRAGKSFGFRVENELGKMCTRPGIDLEIVRPVSLETQKSSAEVFLAMSMCPPGVNSVPQEYEPNLAFKRFETKVRNDDDVDNTISKYEDYLGLSTADMTVKNVSDIFVFLSTVLNNIPDRMKAEKMSSLNPPSTLLTALDILYNADGGCFTEAQKSASFNSLTIQSVSDLFLTLSKTFEDLPDRVKHSRVLDLGPPTSLLNAVHLLTCLPVNSDRVDDEVECTNIGDYHHDDSQDYFYDALDTSCSMNNGATSF